MKNTMSRKFLSAVEFGDTLARTNVDENEDFIHEVVGMANIKYI